MTDLSGGAWIFRMNFVIARTTSRPVCCLAALTVTACVLMCSGCAVSEKARAEQHLSSIVPAGGASNEVIMAFGLDHPPVPDEAVAAAQRND